MKRSNFDHKVKYGLLKPEDDTEFIRLIVNRLLDNLYIPVKTEQCFVTDANKLKELFIDGEPINWGDLKCCDVEYDNHGGYIITIDEASPDGCPNLCEYIMDHMIAWGWNIVEVKTEW